MRKVAIIGVGITLFRARYLYKMYFDSKKSSFFSQIFIKWIKAIHSDI